MQREFSAGGIIFRRNNEQLEFLITQHSTNKHWGFPKGKINPGENSQQAALREVKEEAGIEAKIINQAGNLEYIYTLNGEKIFKVVTLYLMEYVSGDPKDHDWEVSEAVWLNPEEAIERLSFKDENEMLRKIIDTFKGVSS